MRSTPRVSVQCLGGGVYRVNLRGQRSALTGAGTLNRTDHHLGGSVSSVKATVAQGQRLGLSVWITEDDEPVPLTTPAMMDVRAGADRTTPLIARADSTPGAGEGSVTEDGLERGGLIVDLDTTDIDPGFYYLDLWSRRVADPTTPALIASGTLRVTARITDEITADA